MRDFVDKTSVSNGTPLNRDYMMAIQGFESTLTKFNSDGTIVEENELGQKKTTTFNSDGTIVETFVGDKTLIKTTYFNSDGSITEVIS